MPKGPWFKDGVRFACTRCGKCCGGGPGYVWVSEEEVRALAERLQISTREFRQRHTFKTPKGGTSLRDKENYDCIFYDRDTGCTVYEDRPRQCRTWPFWDKVMTSQATWDIEAEDCPGMNKGPRHEAESILRVVRDDGIGQ
jgi:Fe-S-cluster containining protein